jgi:hypothetical protein
MIHKFISPITNNGLVDTKLSSFIIRFIKLLPALIYRGSCIKLKHTFNKH